MTNTEPLEWLYGITIGIDQLFGCSARLGLNTFQRPVSCGASIAAKELQTTTIAIMLGRWMFPRSAMPATWVADPLNLTLQSS